MCCYKIPPFLLCVLFTGIMLFKGTIHLSTLKPTWYIRMAQPYLFFYSGIVRVTKGPTMTPFTDSDMSNSTLAASLPAMGSSQRAAARRWTIFLFKWKKNTRPLTSQYCTRSAQMLHLLFRWELKQATTSICCSKKHKLHKPPKRETEIKIISWPSYTNQRAGSNQCELHTGKYLNFVCLKGGLNFQLKSKELVDDLQN